MEEQNKYYIPEYNELVLGDKIQCWHSMDIQRWEDDIFQGWEIDCFKKYIALGAVRVKCLDKSDIESLGWVHTGGQMVVGGRKDFELPNTSLVLKHFPRNNDIVIARDASKNAMVLGSTYDILFDGQCKSINELRIIHKLLQIN